VVKIVEAGREAQSTAITEVMTPAAAVVTVSPELSISACRRLLIRENRRRVPVIAKDGTVTAANSSSISDGAAALVLTTLGEAERRGLTPLARIVGQASHARAPSQFTTAPVGALKRLFEITGWTPGDVDLYEINEAFAVVAMVAMRELDLPHDKVNVNGGACALGHPIGASGARILVTLIEALKARDLKRGVASLCIGGGEATAVAIERLN
jgi:acetyl-CoA C-acetyltransferase